MNSIKNSVYKTLILFIFFIGLLPLSACGLKGDLYQTPENKVPQKIKNDTDDKVVKSPVNQSEEK